MSLTAVARRVMVRHRMCIFAEYLYANRSKLAYSETRPMRSFFTKWCTMPRFSTDCSESTSMIAHASWAPTPYVVNNEGYTGTQLATLPHIALSQTRRGDFCVFVAPERPGGDHVVMLLQGGIRHADPLVWSHGHNGVDKMPLSQMQAGFPDHATVCLKTVPDKYSRSALLAARA